ncbi:DUF2793 domain-containing protein [Tabrizicola oligotrophica]|uniref:DUF2793 domain-containing protein n=1 Tax=Tabrizicola oligotrophica TaxID=2710650 RepID=A0A6M0QX93_9RHOB|nr:DUF2793 domain-containing protein [Tabrizicola oligotrophica]NEY92116.1 DUF2793 domain-containing protein [Tabrizicola oligotrophica]
MPDLSPILSLPLMQASQAQKHVTHNEAVMQLDLLVQLTVTDRTRTAPPASPVEGQRHIVAAAPTGAWAGQADKIALWLDGLWQFVAPVIGWRVWIATESLELVHDGAAWVSMGAASVPAVLAVDQLGVSASSDATNRLALSSPASLFDHAGAGHQVKVNKSAAAQTASLLFQNNYSGRAEMGLVGDNHFSVNVSSNGTTFNTAMKITAGTAEVEIFKPVQLTGQATAPAGPTDGLVWHDSTRGQVFARVAGQTRVIDQQADLPCLVPPVGEYVITTMGSGGATTVLTGAANRLDLFPYVSSTDLTVDALGVNCTTAVASALCKLVVYEALANGQPGSLLLETATADLSTTGNKVLTASLTLLRGRTYWLGVRHSSTAVLSAWALQATPDINGGTTMVTTARKTLRRTVTFATAAPASWGFVNSEINAAVATAIWLRMA